MKLELIDSITNTLMILIMIISVSMLGMLAVKQYQILFEVACSNTPNIEAIK